MAPSRSATSITWSVGTKRNEASWSTNFLMSQGQATRSTLTRSRVIHFMGDLPSCACRSNRDDIDQQRDDRNPDTEPFKAALRNLWAKRGVHSEKQIRYERAEHIIGAGSWNGVIVESRHIACCSP